MEHTLLRGMFPPEAWRWREAPTQSKYHEHVSFLGPFHVHIELISAKYSIITLNMM